MKYLIFVFFCVICFCCEEPETPRESNVLSVYPNPCRNVFGVRLGNANPETYYLQVFDPKGKQLLDEIVTSEETFQIEAADKGAYEVILKYQNETITRKAIRL
jgi:hypothetical protein